MVLAAAQTNSAISNFKSNLDDHIRYIELAANEGADLIAFPEMSLTSYTRETAQQQAITLSDNRLCALQILADKYKMLIIASAPILLEKKLYIGTLVFTPEKSINLYTKHYLHTGEELFFKSSFDHDPLIEWGGERICLATCYDIEVPEHPAAAHKRGCTLYVAGIYYMPASMEGAHKTLGGYAQQHHMNVLMANYVGQPWTDTGGGQSAYWNSTGEKIAALGTDQPGLLIVENRTSN